MDRIRIHPRTQPGTSSQGGGGYLWLGVVVVGVAILGTMGFLGLFFALGKPKQETPESVVVVAHPTPLLITSTLVRDDLGCLSVTRELAMIEQYQQLSHWDMAATYAEGVLGIPNLCAADRAGILRQALLARYEGIFAKKFDPLDMEVQFEAVEVYEGLLRRDAQAGMAVVPGPLAASERGYACGMFVFTKEVLDRAYRRGVFDGTNQTVMQRYCSAWYNQGVWLVTKGHDETQRQAGMRWLATSAALDRDPRYRVGQGQAWGELRLILGEDEQRWPPPLDSPLLR